LSTSTAAEHVATAAHLYREARADARRAEHFYASARTQHEASLMSNIPNGADFARNAVDFNRCADMYLQASFRATEQARFYSQLARDYLRHGW
jgi:hypothetical protein